MRIASTHAHTSHSQRVSSLPTESPHLSTHLTDLLTSYSIQSPGQAVSRTSPAAGAAQSPGTLPLEETGGMTRMWQCGPE